MLDDVEGALWTDELIEQYREGYMPLGTPLRIIGVDPSVAENPRDECGIVVCASTSDRDLYKRNAENLALGIDAISLCKLRSKIAMQAISTGALPYHLETVWNTLMREGYFEAYHYWLFAAIEDPNTYTAWLQYHKGAEKELIQKINSLEF